MLFIYYLSDGEMYQASIPEKNLEEFFGEKRAKEMSKVFGAVYIEKFNPMVFYNFKDFKVINGKLEMKEDSDLADVLKIPRAKTNNK